MIVGIQGGGVTAHCCAHLMRAAGLEISATPVERPPVPVILLSDPALALLRDVLGRPELFAGRTRITRRVVSWGGGAPVEMPHGAIVVTGNDLADAMPLRAAGDITQAADLTIHTMPPMPEGELHRFGERSGSAVLARLLHDEDETACRVEAVAAGWLFLMPCGERQGWLLAVGDGSPQDLLAMSRDIAPRIVLTGESSTAFDTGARMRDPLCGPGWLACGTSAIAFDPICGDGTAQAAREAILASAVAAALARGEVEGDLETHYASMLLAAMRRHLQLSASFYASGGDTAWWRVQHAAVIAGHDWCTRRLSRLPEPRFLLRGFDLVRREKAA